MSIRIVADQDQPSAAIEISLEQPLPDYDLFQLDQPTPRDVDALLVSQGFRDLVDDARGVLMDLLVNPPFQANSPEHANLDFTHSAPLALELTQLRVVADEGKHGKGKPNPASSVLKIKGSEIQQTTTELLMEVIGPFAAPYDEHGDDGSNEAMDWTAQIAPSYFNNRKVSIYGGSNEIQRNIITKAVLGL